MIRAILCDDEPLALDRLAGLVHRIENVSIVATAGNGVAALEAIRAFAPEVVFLDIEMPGLDGFDVVEELARARDSAPLIVFVTAYPQFAAHAFDTGAIDFLTKPVRLGRLETAVARIRDALADRDAAARLAELSAQLLALRDERNDDLKPGNHLWVQRRGETVRIDLDQVDLVSAEGEYVRLHVGGVSYLHREPISAILRRFDPRRYLRVHRSYIVNRDRIVAIRRRTAGGYKLVLEGEIEVPVGRSYRAAAWHVIDKGGGEA